MAEETVVEVVEEAVEHLAPLNLNGTTRAEQATVLVMAGIVGAALGATATYFVVRNRLKAHYEQIANDEIQEARRFYTKLHKDGDASDPEVLAARYADDNEEARHIVGQEGYAGHPALAPVASKEEPEEVVVEDKVRVTRVKRTNIFEESQADQQFDLEHERDTRTNSAPYIITQEEFMENEDGFDTFNLIYYDDGKDGVLVDERAEVIPDSDKCVGDDNLMRFGHGSNNPSVLYVCNPVTQAYYEVLRNQQSYAETVLGFKHEDSRPRRVRRMRGDDE